MALSLKAMNIRFKLSSPQNQRVMKSNNIILSPKEMVVSRCIVGINYPYPQNQSVVKSPASLVSTRPSRPSETGLIDIKRNSKTLSPQTRTPSNGGSIRNLALRLGLRPTVASLINRSTPFVMNQNLP